MNTERLGEIIGIITKWPERYDQTLWHRSCGTAHCIAGWCEIIATGKEWSWDTPEFSLPDKAQEYLDINEDERYWLFCIERSLQDIKNFWEFEGIPGEGFQAEDIDWPSLAPELPSEVGIDERDNAIIS